MAAKTPVTDTTSNLYVERARGVVGFNGSLAVNASLASNGTRRLGKESLRLSIYAFSDIDDTDTWTSGLSGVVALAWQPDQADTDKVGASLTDIDTGEITFDAENANSSGWLWVLHSS